MKFYIKKLLLLFTIVQVIFSCSKENSFTIENRKQKFNDNWSFYQAKDSLEKIDNNTNWQVVKIPHDFSISGNFAKDNPGDSGTGYLPGGVGYYTKNFTTQNDTKLTFIQFDGVYMNSEVWINGNYLGKRPSGYSSFEYNLTPYLNNNGKENTLLVKADNSKQPNSRWYSGSGIYRNVWLKTVDKLYVINDGTFITTPKVSKESANVNIEITIDNKFETNKEAEITTTIYKNNTEVNSTSKKVSFRGKSNKTINQQLVVKNPSLWSVDTPEMYSAITEIKIGNKVIDQYKTPFGIRTFKFDTEKGFILNGEQIKIKGVCLHHDLGPLGSAINTCALERQLQIMKDMGVNGIRTSHNMPAPEQLELCDKMGFIVMDEAFDIWKENKSPYDYALYWDKWHKKDLEDFIRRDRNHPSVFIWSTGNEVLEQWRGDASIADKLYNIVKKLDTTRPVTIGMNPPVNMSNKGVTTQFNVTYNNVSKSNGLDLVGYNYAHQTWEHHKKNFPNKPFIATETTSGLQTRGYYDTDSKKINLWPVRWDIPFDEGNPGNTSSAYDQTRTPWGSLHETSWKIIKKHDFLSGMFVWTGFDYIGEPTPYVWPSRSSYFGIVDLAGFPKDVYYMYQSEWTNKDVLHIFPHWNWKKGETVDVWAYYNNADEVELFVNGKSQGIKKKKGDDLHIMCRIPFEAGTLKAVSRKDGKIVLEKEIKTAGEASKLNLTADRQTIKANGEDLSFITVDIQDKDGNFVATANNLIQFELEGNGEIVGVSSGDPVNHQNFKGKEHNALNGKCLVIIQAGDNAGTLTLKATSKNLLSKSIIIKQK